MINLTSSVIRIDSTKDFDAMRWLERSPNILMRHKIKTQVNSLVNSGLVPA